MAMRQIASRAIPQRLSSTGKRVGSGILSFSASKRSAAKTALLGKFALLRPRARRAIGLPSGLQWSQSRDKNATLHRYKSEQGTVRLQCNLLPRASDLINGNTLD